MANWTDGMACRVVEHDPDTRQPKPGGETGGWSAIVRAPSGAEVRAGLGPSKLQALEHLAQRLGDTPDSSRGDVR